MTLVNPYKNIKHLKLTPWNWCVSYVENFKLGKDVDIGIFSFFQCKYGVTLCDNVKIGSHCSIYSHDTIGGHKGPVVLEEGCCIGSHSVILPNVIISKGLIIPAFSLVKRSILTQKDLDLFYIKTGRDNPNRSNIDQELINSYL